MVVLESNPRVSRTTVAWGLCFHAFPWLLVTALSLSSRPAYAAYGDPVWKKRKQLTSALKEIQTLVPPLDSFQLPYLIQS